jgi:hypothetical protein
LNLELPSSVILNEVKNLAVAVAVHSPHGETLRFAQSLP